MAQMIVPMPWPERFGPSMSFTLGELWVENRVALELPVSKWRDTGIEMVPIFLSKQKNDCNYGWELHYTTPCTLTKQSSVHAVKWPFASTLSVWSLMGAYSASC